MQLAGVILYLAVLIGIGALAARRMKNLRDFVVAGKGLRYWAAAFSARATGESAWLLLGLTGMGFAIGVQGFWVVIGEMLGVGGAWLFMARRFKRLSDRYDALTMPDYLEARLRSRDPALRLVAAGALVVFVSIYVSAQIHATGEAFDSFLDWNYYAGATVGFAVVLLYTAGGGFLAVVWSDIFQGAMMFVGLVTLPIVGLIAVGGPGPLMSGLESIDPTLVSFTAGRFGSATGIAGVLSLVCIGIGFLGSPQIFVRFIGLRSEREIPPGTAVALVWTFCADSGAVLIGMLARYQLTWMELGQKEQALAELAEHLLPAFAVGLYIAVVLAATMSTADSLLVVAASAAVRDWYQKVKRPDLPDDELVAKSRLATVIIAVVSFGIAMAVALNTGRQSIFWYVVFGWSGIAATFCPTVILSLFWSGLTRTGALAAMITGFVCVPAFTFWIPKIPQVGPFFGALGELLPSFLFSAAAGIVVSLRDREGRTALDGVAAELKDAAGPRE